jgi:hypothetical protein
MIAHAEHGGEVDEFGHFSPMWSIDDSQHLPKKDKIENSKESVSLSCRVYTAENALGRPTNSKNPAKS